MPSKAYKTFKNNVKQVDRLLLAFTDMRTPTRGRKHLDHFTRAALMFLCSSWEVYIEQVSLESCKIITGKVESPDMLPESVQKNLSRQIKDAKHDLEPIAFATNWKVFYEQSVATYVSKLNTPKKDNVMEILNKHLGLNDSSIRAKVPTLPNINIIVKTRGEIAHNVFTDEYLKKEVVDQYYDTIKRAVVEIELLLWDYLPTATDNKRPWQNTY